MDQNCMTEQHSDNEIKLEILLGGIEMTLAELLSLTPGAEITVDLPEVHWATLKLGGSPWAIAKVKRNSQGLMLAVSEICFNQETPLISHVLGAETYKKIAKLAVTAENIELSEEAKILVEPRQQK